MFGCNKSKGHISLKFCCKIQSLSSRIWRCQIRGYSRSSKIARARAKVQQKSKGPITTKLQEGGCKREGDAQLHEYKQMQQQWSGTWKKVTTMIRTKKVMTIIKNITEGDDDD